MYLQTPPLFRFDDGAGIGKVHFIFKAGHKNDPVIILGLVFNDDWLIDTDVHLGMAELTVLQGNFYNVSKNVFC